MNETKLYVQDNGVDGCIIVRAENEEEARKFMSTEYNYNAATPIEELNSGTDKGIIFSNYGDI